MSGPLSGAAFVTGGSRRLGRVLALAAAEAGFDVALHVRTRDESAAATGAEIGARGRGWSLHVGDLREESAPALLDEAAAELGPVTLLVNSAALFEEDAFETMGRPSLSAHLDTNLRAPLELAQAFARNLPPGAEGMIVNVLDQRVLDPGADFFSYTVSKCALWSATRMPARHLAPRIRVNAIGPGPTLASIHQTAQDFEGEVATTLLKRPVDQAEISRPPRSPASWSQRPD